MPSYVGEVWIDGVRGQTVFFDAADAVEASRCIAARGADLTRNPARRFEMRTTVKLAEASFVPEWIRRMFDGDRINVTEDRSVLHVALRRSSAPFPGAG